MQNRCSVDRINVWFGSLACDFLLLLLRWFWWGLFCFKLALFWESEFILEAAAHYAAKR